MAYTQSLFTLACLSATFLTSACDQAVENKADKVAEALFEKAVAAESVPGISVALAGRDGVIWAKGFGYADLEQQTPMSTKTKMRIGSVAKIFTTAALMRLYDQGLVDLDKDVRDYVPLWPTSHEIITLRQLTSHTAGVRHYNGREFELNTHSNSVTESLDIFKDSDLLYSPGTDHRYSTYAWSLVSAASEGADGKRDFKQIVREEVFKPLALKDSSFDEKETIISNRQRPYQYVDGKLINAKQTDHSYKWAGGGFIASTSDVARFAMAHNTAGYLKGETLDEMFTKAKLADGTEVPFGVGWIVGYDRYIERYADNPEALALMKAHGNAVMHSGGSMGGITMMILCREHNHAVTVVKNVSGEDSANVFLLALQTLDIFTTR